MKNKKRSTSHFDSNEFFTKSLLAWYFKKEPRDLPWKETLNAYHIWLSEIILQQTRVEQGKPYYKKFVTTYPTIKDLADAPEDDVMKLWQGLGYYSRARNLHHTAQFIRDQYDGIFPGSYALIRSLKGVGDYTAAAIASFAYNLPHAVVDGNVYRVLSRYFANSTPIDSSLGKKQFAQLAQNLLDEEQPSDFNQAIMDLGALVCKPKSPLCKDCPLSKGCLAYQNQNVTAFPIKGKKMERKQRFFYYFVWNSPEGNTILKKREDKDIWQGLFDFPLVELDELVAIDNISLLLNHKKYLDWFDIDSKEIRVSQTLGPYKQILTHQHIVAFFIKVEGPIPLFFSKKLSYIEVEPKNIKKFAVPKIVEQYFQQQQTTLF